MRVRVCGLIEQDGKILVLRYQYPGGVVHAIPGGTVDDGENLKDCLEREYLEELGIEIRVGALLYVADMPAHGKIKQTLHIVFKAELLKGDPKINPEETTAETCLWLARSSLEDATLYPPLEDALLQDQDSDGNTRYLGIIEREWA